jgi:hypothetical protein
MLKQALGCVANVHVISNKRPELHKVSVFALTENPSSLGNSPYALFFLQYMVVPDDRAPGEYKVKTLEYEYKIERRKDRQEIVCFHWEGDDAKNPVPHIHIGFGAKSAEAPFSPKTHIPSGRVPIEDVVAFLIQELHVQPAKRRKLDWDSVLATVRKLFFRFKIW